MKKHYVETFFGGEGETKAEYLGLREEKDQYAKVSCKLFNGTIAVPSLFDSQSAALTYCEKVKQKGRKYFWLVQEFNYSDGRQDKAKIIAYTIDDTYPAFSEGQSINDINGKVSVTHVKTMWFCDRDVAARYVAAFNQCVVQQL